MSYIFTSESVSAGHPDKICDQISDAILDACLAQDKNSRVACETMVKNNNVILGGEITTTAEIDYEQIARNVVKDIGYDHETLGFSYDSFAFTNYISEQSKDISAGIAQGEQLGSGDQGIMFGYACRETPELMPLPIALAHQLTRKHEALRQDRSLGLRPDAKSQVAVEYNDIYQPQRIDSIVFSSQHDPNLSLDQLRELIKEEIIQKTLPQDLIDNKTRFFINPAGRFEIGGPVGDCGLTGRKIIVDTYGGMARHGGGAFSGKDPSKVDRSAAYALRQVAKSLVAANFCDYCEIQASYAIGVAEPTSIFVNTFESEKKPVQEIEQVVLENFNLTPSGIIEFLGLLAANFRKTASYGHFGREDQGFAWEKIVDLNS
ncbi:MAG: methionine adenosyltransferase [SAR86 cluster bacterium]|nr:methionine adenosyltransferase [SAR86 cluster bacterium]